MIERLAAASVYVNDVEAALAFWVERIGFVKRTDATFQGMRWVEVAPEGAETALVLVHDFGDWRPELVGGHAGILLQASDVPALHKRLLAAGVQVIDEPTQMPWGWQLQFADPDGNVFVVQG